VLGEIVDIRRGPERAQLLVIETDHDLVLGGDDLEQLGRDAIRPGDGGRRHEQEGGGERRGISDRPVSAHVALPPRLVMSAAGAAVGRDGLQGIPLGPEFNR
jgi:hypothetical protein